MLSHYRHISFDLDGTLVHTVPEYRYWLVPKVIRELGGKENTQEVIDRFWFETNRDVIIESEFSIDAASFWRLFRTMDVMEQRSRHTHAYDDAEGVLRELKNQGKVLSIITGSPQPIADMEIAKLNGAPLDYYFSVTSSQYQIKPDPASFHHVLQKLAMRPEETLYIGNGNEDAEFAHNTGTDFIFLERKEHNFFLGQYSLKTIHTLHDLLLIP